MSEQTIAVIGAMEQEIALLRARMEEVQTLSFGSFTACAGRYAGKRMVLAWVVHQFNPDCVINTGSAGGLGKGLKVGDVVIGDKAAHHDVDVTAFGYEWGQVPRLPAVFDADERLVGAAEQAASVFEGASVRRGLIASGDQFVHSSGRVAEIRSRFPDIQAVEMEAAAIAQTCTQLGVPFVVIRAVSDSADEKADVSFDEFLKTAAVHSAEMVLKMMERL